jgi:serine/threonine protein kinase
MEGKLLAAKELEKRRFMKNGQLDKKIDNEMKIMQTVRHPNIVEFVEYQDQGDHLYIIMEFVRYGDLQGYLNQNGNLSEPQAKMMAQQILSALSYLHRAKITHRDIKPDNILIAEVEPFRVKLSDFGLSKVVKHEETFLKTFCGTLLYCAPEVFPDFEGKAAQGTKRRRGAKQKFHSYSSSVDIWSFAAVLWFALCGKPPFEGIADATGRAMYNNIMTTRLDPTPLRNAGVSEPCISLLCQMLQTDPALRPTDRDCLNHPWLRDGVAIPEDPALQSIVEEDESDVAGEQLSQLSLREEILESEEEEEASGVLEDEDFEKLVNHPAAKKVRTDPVPARYQLGQAEEVSYADPSFPSGHIVENGHRVEESFSIMGKAAAGRERLFGEIGESALESSGILSAHANNALSHDASSSEVLPDTVAPQNVTPQAQRRTQERGLTSPTLVGRAQLDGVFSSPSLLGAESMVRELNMESPHSPVSGTHSPNEPTTPKTPDVPQHNSLEGHSHRVSQISDSTPKAKPPALNRQISLPKTASFYYDPFDPSTHTLEYASRVSGFDFVGAAQATMPKDQHLPDTVRFSTDTGENTSHETSQTGRSTSSEEVVALPPELSIKPPPRRLGKLTATADSFNPNLTLMIERSLTSWGRNRDNTIVYEDPQDIRVSKRSFNIFWYTSDATSIPITDLSQQGKDWTSLPGLHVGIFTCATSGISINGKHLRQNDDKGRALWGHLHTGDIVQVYANPLSTECLKFKCEFHLGSAKMPRPPGESFVILHGDKLPGRGGSILNA